MNRVLTSPKSVSVGFFGRVHVGRFDSHLARTTVVPFSLCISRSAFGARSNYQWQAALKRLSTPELGWSVERDFMAIPMQLAKQRSEDE